MALFGLIPSRKENKKDKVDAKVAREDEAVRKFAQGLIEVKDIIAPSAIEVDFNHMVIGGKVFQKLLRN
jgi:hypothetical protein